MRKKEAKDLNDPRAVFESYKDLKIAVVGDVMLDHYIQSSVARTSPEAPVAVAAVKSDHYIPGGAANVAANIARMGATAYICGLTGADEGAGELKKLLKERGVKSSLLAADRSRPTTLKTRIMAQGQQIIRIDRETKRPASPKMQDKILKKLEGLKSDLHGIILSDYAKGVCAPEFIKRLIAFARTKKLPVICDPKGLDFSRYKGVDVITPNFKEAREASGSDLDTQEELDRAAGKIIKNCRLKALVVTMGDRGVSLFEKGAPARRVPAHAREVYDVTGAGDTFISHFGMARFSGLPFFDAVQLGNYASAVAVGKLGVAAVNPEELLDFIRGENFVTKLKDRKELKEIVTALQAAGKKVVFTNGCFDLLHVGHIKFLQAARGLGDCLIVGVNTDASVRKVKGHGRPFMSETERADLLSALHWVDHVIVFDEETPKPILAALKPDVLVKGENLKKEEIVGYELVESYGGEIRRLPMLKVASSNDRLKKLFEDLKKLDR